MSYRGTGRGRGRGAGDGGRGKRQPSDKLAVRVNRDATGNYQISEKILVDCTTRSVSDFSSLTDVSFPELSTVEVELHSSLMKRLFQEYVQVRKYKLSGVSVEPLLNNFTEWHGNILGPKGTPYEGGIFHFTLCFNNDHPKSPPVVKMVTRIEHPCVSYGVIELDILKPLDTKRKNFRPPSNSVDKARNWFPGYTTLSILLQLEALLYEGTVDVALRALTDLSAYEDRKSKWESGVRFSVEQSIHMSCPSCKHRPRKPWPIFENVSGSKDKTLLDGLYLENAVCFYSLKKYNETPLGIGINYTKDARTGAVQRVKCVPTVVSLSSFKSNKANEVWGESFTHWMPLYFTAFEPERSLYLAKRSISSIYTGNPQDFQPSMILDFFPRLLTSTTVAFIEAEDGSQSLQYLRAYCYMHCLFLRFLQVYPDLKESAKKTLDEFIGNPASRHIDCLQNSGVLMIYTTFTNSSWNDLMEPFIRESFDRNVRHIIKAFPELDTCEPNDSIDTTRIAKSFASCNVTGIWFVMMQLAFNRLFLSPGGASIDIAFESYDKYFSQLPRELEDQLLEQIGPIKSVKSFKEYFQHIGFQVETDKEIISILRESVANSLAKHYHGGKETDVLSPEEFEKQRLGSIKPLNKLLENNDMTDDDWKELAQKRFGLSELPETYSVNDYPWKCLYLQHNLQEFVGKLNDNPDFKLLYETLDLSKDVLSHFELTTFNPHNIKSQYYFLSRIVEMLPHLTHLTITKGETGLGEKGFKELVKGMARSSGSLKVLNLKYLGIEESHVSKLAESSLTSDGLVTLILEGNHLGTEGTVKLSQLIVKHRSLPNIAELNLRACQISDKGLEALAEALLVKRNIRKIDLSKNDASQQGLAKVIQNLAYSSCIEEINLSEFARVRGRYDQLSNALGRLFQLTVSLKKLNLWKTNLSQCINEQNMKQLAANTSLTVLDMACNSSGGHQALGLVLESEVSGLKELDLSGNNLDVDKWRTIYEKSKKHTSGIVKLHLDNNETNFLNVTRKKNYELMLNLFSITFANVTDLNLSNNALISDAAKVLGDVLAANTSLVHLDISKNQIGKHGARFLAAGLSKNKNLRVLRLDRNNLRSAGAHFLSAVLSQPSCLLTDLHLFCNYIDVPGTIAMCQALKTNEHLTFLDLGLNKIRKRGTAAVIDMLSVNKCLQTISLKFNYIPDSWAIQVVKQIVEKDTCQVRDIRLAGNSLQYDTLVGIVNLLETSSRNFTFDLYSRAKYLDPERMEKTVYVSPIAANVTPEMLKKLFYSKKCGAITAIAIEKHRKRKASFAKANYAFIEFAHKDSVELAVDLMRHRDAHLGAGFQPRITRAGLNTK